MRQSDLLIGIIGVVTSMILVVIALLASMGGMGWMGGHMSNEDSGFTELQALILIAGIAILTISIAFLIYSDFSDRRIMKSQPLIMKIPQEEPKNFPESAQDPDPHHISKSLDGDERNLYQIIASSGGIIMQKDIVERKIFSKAKVTRLLDKLEEKNLIVRERNGMTNRIRLVK